MTHWVHRRPTETRGVASHWTGASKKGTCHAPARGPRRRARRRARRRGTSRSCRRRAAQPSSCRPSRACRRASRTSRGATHDGVYESTGKAAVPFARRPRLDSRHHPRVHDPTCIKKDARLFHYEAPPGPTAVLSNRDEPRGVTTRTHTYQSGKKGSLASSYHSERHCHAWSDGRARARSEHSDVSV